MKNIRIASVDIFRALTMLIMLWVNDSAGMDGIPHWFGHAEGNEDLLGFSDLVFPAFLFCVGMSVPFAVKARYAKGESHLQVLLHVVTRTLALLIMGIFDMNMRGVKGGMSHTTFSLLMVAGFFLLWNAYPSKDGHRQWWARVLQMLGAGVLIFLVIYKDCHGMPFRRGWWGILGLIGWAYLACALAYIFTQGKFKSIVIAWAAAILLCVLNDAPFIPGKFSSKALLLNFYPGGWTHIALTASGMLASSMLLHFSGENKDRNLIASYILLGAAMFCFGLISHNFWIISKIQATPTWLFFCTAIYFPVFALFYWIADVKGKTSWARPISPAGTATLTCYTIPTLWYSCQHLLHAWWPEALSCGLPGLTRSMAFAFIIIFLTWVFGKCHIRLKI